MEASRRDWPVASRAFVVFVFFLASTGLLIPLLQQEDGAGLEAGQGSPITQAVWLCVYIVSFVLVALRWRRFAALVAREKVLLALIGIALVSVLWSEVPEVTLRRSVALIGTTLFGVYLAMRFSLGEQVRLLGWYLGIAALSSLGFVLVLPSYGISSDPLTAGAWQGIFDHKNGLGSNMALASVVFLLLATSGIRRRWVVWCGLVLAVALLVLSRSATGLVVLTSIALLWPLYQALRWRYTLVVPVLIGLVLTGGVLALVLLANAQEVLTVLGRDTTLTGRTELWAYVMDMVRERPWLGYGYSAFWLGWEGPSSYVWLMTGSEVPAADNGLLDLWLDIGLLGVAVFGLSFVLAFARAVRWARTRTSMDSIWPLIFLTFMLLYGVTESVVLRQNSLIWILYVSTAISVAAYRDATAEPAKAGDLGNRRVEPPR